MATLVWLARFSFDSNVGPNLAPTPTYSPLSTPSIEIGTLTRTKLLSHPGFLGAILS